MSEPTRAQYQLLRDRREAFVRESYALSVCSYRRVSGLSAVSSWNRETGEHDLMSLIHTC